MPTAFVLDDVRAALGTDAPRLRSTTRVEEALIWVLGEAPAYLLVQMPERFKPLDGWCEVQPLAAKIYRARLKAGDTIPTALRAAGLPPLGAKCPAPPVEQLTPPGGPPTPSPSPAPSPVSLPDRRRRTAAVNAPPLKKPERRPPRRPREARPPRVPRSPRSPRARRARRPPRPPRGPRAPRPPRPPRKPKSAILNWCEVDLTQGLELFMIRPVSLPAGEQPGSYLGQIKDERAAQIRELHGDRIRYKKGEGLLLPAASDGTCFLGICGGGAIGPAKKIAAGLASRWKTAREKVEEFVRPGVRRAVPIRRVSEGDELPPPTEGGPTLAEYCRTHGGFEQACDRSVYPYDPGATPAPTATPYWAWGATANATMNGSKTNQCFATPPNRSPTDYGGGGLWQRLPAGYEVFCTKLG